jgi:hypothetical protein
LNPKAYEEIKQSGEDGYGEQEQKYNTKLEGLRKIMVNPFKPVFDIINIQNYLGILIRTILLNKSLL